MRHSIRTTFLLMSVWFGALSSSNAEFAATRTQGIFVLDDCDKQFKDKEKYEDHLTFVNSTGKVGFQVTGINVCESVGCHHVIAVDAPRKCLWVSENVGDCIRKYDFDGKASTVISAKGCGAIAVHPETGNLWVLVSANGTLHNGKTVVFDAKGRELTSYDAYGVDIVYSSQENAFWIVGNRLEKIFVADGFVDLSQYVATWCGVSIDVDQQSGAVWIAVRDHPDVEGSKNELLKFDRYGRRLAVISLDKKDPFQVSVDQQDGSVWMVNFHESLERFSADGRHLISRPVPALTVQADRSGEVWAVTGTQIQKLDLKGEALVKIDLAGKTGEAWIGIVE